MFALFATSPELNNLSIQNPNRHKPVPEFGIIKNTFSAVLRQVKTFAYEFT
jgi:hypothetical protein